MGVVRAPGTVTVGVDKSGKHYKYEAGKGRGRQPLNLNQAQAQALAARGLKPGNTLSLSAGEAAMLGGGTGGAPQPMQPAAGQAGPGKGNRGVGSLGPAQANPDIGAEATAIGMSHQRWYDSGGYKTPQGRTERLQKILSDQNIAWLENAGPNPTASQKTFAGSILATIFGKNMSKRSKANFDKGEGENKEKTVLSVKFHPGGNGQHGMISLVAPDGTSRGSIAFHDLHELKKSPELLHKIRDDYVANEHDTKTPQPGSHHQLYETAERLIDRSKVSKEHKEQYKTAMRHVLNRVPKVAADRMKESIKSVSFHDDWQSVTEQVQRLDKDFATKMKGAVVHGAYQQSTGLLIIDGGDKKGPGDIPGVYAHELTHSIDSKHEFSKSPEWRSAWSKEGKEISNYAAKSPAEGFAEFGRMLYSGSVSKSQLDKYLPNVTKFFESKGLLPEHFDDSPSDKKYPFMRDLFSEPLMTSTTTGDGHIEAGKPGEGSVEKELKLKGQGKRVTQTPSGYGVQNLNDPSRRFEGDKHKTYEEALQSAFRHPDQAKHVDAFLNDIGKHDTEFKQPAKPVQRDLFESPTETHVKSVQAIASKYRGHPVTGTHQSHESIRPKETGPGIAEAYGKLKDDNLSHPMVRKAYENLTKEISEQYKHMDAKIEVWKGEGEPYKNSGEMRNDLASNKHLYVKKTDAESFGPKGHKYDNHPMLADSGVKDVNGEPLLHNDLFRAVHDYYAHSLTPAEFGPKGEEAAWRNHMEMTKDPLAKLALTSETRGQNSYVNFGPNAEHNRKNPQNTIFAPQKVDLLPVEHAMTGNKKHDDELRQAVEKFGASNVAPKKRVSSKNLPLVPMTEDETYTKETKQGADDAKSTVAELQGKKRYSNKDIALKLYSKYLGSKKKGRSNFSTGALGYLAEHHQEIAKHLREHTNLARGERFQ